MARSGIPFRLGKIDHVVLQVHDIEKMVEFYTTVLGCGLERKSEGSELVQLRAGDSLVDLLYVGGASPRHRSNPLQKRTPNMDHFCLQIRPWVDQAILAHLDRHSVAHGPIEQRYGAQGVGPSVYISDPEGNSIELKG